MEERDIILNALQAFIARRPGMEPGNYDPAGYRSESRAVTKDRHHAEKLLASVRWRNGIGAEQLKEAFKRAFSGRLSYWPANVEVDHGGSHVSTSPYPRLDYCTGQYFATEYRKAVCAVLASALWDYWRAGYAEPYPGGGVGRLIRKSARKEFGLEIAQRYFDYRQGDYY